MQVDKAKKVSAAELKKMGYEDYMRQHHTQPKKGLANEFKRARNLRAEESSDVSENENEQNEEEEEEEEEEDKPKPKQKKDKKQAKAKATANGMKCDKEQKDSGGDGLGHKLTGKSKGGKKQKKSKKKKKRKRRARSSNDSSSEDTGDSSDSSSTSGSSTSSDRGSKKKKKKQKQKKKKKKKKSKRPRLQGNTDEGYKAWALHQAQSVHGAADFKMKARLLLKLQKGGTNVKSSTAAAVMNPTPRLITNGAPTQQLLGMDLVDEGDEGDESGGA
jgi:hypothetical protein